VTVQQINLYRVRGDSNRHDTISDLMTDVRAADSYRDTESALLDIRITAKELRPGQGILVWVSEEEED
jgi:hypothetical protein